MTLLDRPSFDSGALFEALDALRRERGVSWQRLAGEAGVAPATLMRTRTGGRMEADGVLAMVRLTGRAPESFAPGSPPSSQPLRPGRLNTQALYEALDAERVRRGLTWPEVMRELGAPAQAHLRLRRGSRVGVDLMLACTSWLGRYVNDFVDPEFEHPGESRRIGPSNRRRTGPSP